MLSTKTNLEITEYHEKFFLGLSLRQLACFGVAAVLAIATCFVCLQWLQLDIQLVSYIIMVEVLPFLGLGLPRRIPSTRKMKPPCRHTAEQLHNLIK